MNHKTQIDHAQGEHGLAEDLGDLRYDTLEAFLGAFAEKMQKDADTDYKRGRIRLSESLHAAAKSLKEAQQHITEAWRISKPYMKEDGSC